MPQKNKILENVLVAILVACAVASCVYTAIVYYEDLVRFGPLHVPTASMYPTVEPGDKVYVNRLAYGKRILNTESDTVRYGDISRQSGYSTIKRNDFIVFNNPFPDDTNRFTYKHYSFMIKRCIALAGDTLEIKDGYYKIRGTDAEVGYAESQHNVNLQTSDTQRIRLLHAPFETMRCSPNRRWNMRNFGPYYIPRSGDTLRIDTCTKEIYRNIFAWENADTTQVHHIVKQNYYFMGGDNALNSNDSRYWGLVPEDFIFGRADLITHD